MVNKTARATKATRIGAGVESQQTATTAAERLSAYNVYDGVVWSIDPGTRKLSVKTVLGGQIIGNCVLMSDSLASLLGFAQTSMPAPGTRVLMLYTPKGSYVLGGVGASVTDDSEVFTGSATGDMELDVKGDSSYGVRRRLKASTAPGYTQSEDILPGEQEFSNNMGVWLRLLTNFAQLSAGDLAKIEVSLVNDMVRIVDNYFAHHSVGGDHLIWGVDGKCNDESHFTGYGFEADGKQKDDGKLVSEKGEYVYDTANLPGGSPASATGRWRKSTYIGYLADMIHTWVSDPAETLSNYADSAHRAGKYRCWVGSDGQLMVQANGGIHLEVSSKVVIPEIKYNWNDPEFDFEKAVNEMDKSFLKLWGKGEDEWKDLTVACWQMSAWAKYITLWHSLARWNALADSEYCTVPSEADAPDPKPTADEKDKEEVNPDGDKPYTGNAILSIDPSGSISLISYGDAKHSGVTSVIMNQGNLQVAAAGNLEISCGGTLSLSAKNVSVKALDHVEIAAIAGGLWLKARTAWNALCEKGLLWLKSDKKKGEEASSDPYPAIGGTPPAPMEGGDYSIILQAAEGKAAVVGKESATVTADGPAANVYIQAEQPGGNVYLYSNNNIVANATNSLVGSSNGAVVLQSVGSGIVMDTRNFYVNDILSASPNSVVVDGQVNARSFSSLDGYIGSNAFVSVYKSEHKDKVDPRPKIKKIDDSFESIIKATTKSGNPVKDEDVESIKDLLWKFNDWELGEGEADNWFTLKQSPVAAATKTVTADGAMSNLVEVLWYSCGLISTSATTATNHPWPGRDCQVWNFKGDSESVLSLTERVAEAKDADPNEFGINAMEKKDYNFYVQK